MAVEKVDSDVKVVAEGVGSAEKAVVRRVSLKPDVFIGGLPNRISKLRWVKI